MERHGGPEAWGQRASSETLSVDVLVIGGGVVGAAILRELSRYDVSIALVERRPDVGDATSKANSAIIHTGFDAPPGTLEARLLAKARDLWPDVVDSLRIPYLPTGALMVATNAREQAAIEGEVIPKARINGVDLQPLTRSEIRDRAPYVGPDVVGGARVEGEGVVDPFWTVRAYCENAVANGARVFTGQGVIVMEEMPRAIRVTTESGAVFLAALVINAAGLSADDVARLAGDASFALTPRKGQFIVVEEDHGVGEIILPVPNKVTKGILVTPIVFGGILLGPTAEDVADKADLSTTAQGLRSIREGVRKLVPAMESAATVRQFAGLRAVSSTGDYIIGYSARCARLLNVAGIRSTGLSASPAIGRHVARLVRERLDLSLRRDFAPDLPEYLDSAQRDEGEVVCLCRSITRGEILAALRSPLPPATLDGVKRRTGAMLGDCQGNICAPRIIELLSVHLGLDPIDVLKNAAGSSPIVGRIPDNSRR